MAAWSWRTWPDLLIDFGREAYVAWRLAEGAVLHRDVVTVSGPLSPYWNAGLFRVFGVGLDTLFVANAIVLAALVAVWHRLLLATADRFAAWAGCMVFVGLFGFAHYVGIGNYNYIAPYAHELPHGLLAASFGMLCWKRILERGDAVGWLAAGAALGLAALTKVEVLVAAAAANALGFALLMRRGTRPLRGAALFGTAAAAPVGIAVLGLSTQLGLGGAVRGVGIGWLRLVEDDVAGLPFYQRGMGIDEPLQNLGIALLWAGRLLGILAPVALLSFTARDARWLRGWIPPLASIGMLIALAPFVSSVSWLQAARPLPFLALCAWGVFGVRALRSAARREPASFERAVLQVMLAAFATLLMAKIFLLGRVYQYGFALGLPAAMLFVAGLLAWVPHEIARRGGSGAIFRGAALGLLAAIAWGHLLVMAPHVEGKTARVGGIGDGIAVRPGVARVIGRTLAAVRTRTEPGDSLAVLPEGVMLNYLTRRPTPTPHFSFNPFEVAVYGEPEILRGFEATPPAAVILVHHDTSEHGARFLGQDYGRELMSWIRAHYETVAQVGDPPLQPGTRFGVAVLERADSAGR